MPDLAPTWCQLAVDIAAAHGVALNHPDASAVLYECTTFPFGTVDDIEDALHEWACGARKETTP